MLALLLTIGAAFAVMAALLTNLVSRTLYAQRTEQTSVTAQTLAVRAAPLMRDARAEALQEMICAAAAQAGGRVLVTDAQGKVQADSFFLLNGTRLRVPEVLSVLGGESTAYGIHALTGELEDGTGETYAALCAARMDAEELPLGALLLVTPVTELRQSLLDVEKQFLTVFVLMAFAAIAAALLIAGVLTRPVAALTKTIRRMGRGDLSARVNVRASGEMRELADSYNAMAEKIEHLDISRGQFVSNASHELKTPLATMKILLENLMYQPDMPQEVRLDFMQDIDHELDRLSGIVTDLLTLSRMDSHAAQLQLSAVNLSQLAEETLHTLRPAAEKRGQALDGDIAPEVCLTADGGKLAQVLYNLIDNALKYTPEGGHVHLTLRRDAKEATLVVTDDGIGIPEEDQAHIFDRFYRVDKARSRATGGTGLGLSIVRQMVQLHGGRVQVRSKPGEGSAFTVTLPLKREGKSA